jgi:hypothetical protein
MLHCKIVQRAYYSTVRYPWNLLSLKTVVSQRFTKRTIMTKNALGYDVLEPKVPVPSDIDVSQSIVREIGMLSMQELAQQ